MQTQTTKIVGAIISAIAMTTAAYATTEGPYLGIQAGETNTHNVSRNVSTPSGLVKTTPTNTGVGVRIFGGGNFNQYTAIEGGFTHYAASTYKAPNSSNPTVKENAIDIVGKGMLPIDNFGLFVKGGIAIVGTSLSGSLSKGSSEKGSNTYVRPIAGLGASYDITQSFVVDFTASRIFGGGTFQSADFFALGLSYHFVDKRCGQFLC